jgi:hypothetical protein
MMAPSWSLESGSCSPCFRGGCHRGGWYMGMARLWRGACRYTLRALRWKGRVEGLNRSRSLFEMESVGGLDLAEEQQQQCRPSNACCLFPIWSTCNGFQEMFDG